MRALIIDDSRVLRRLVGDMMRSFGFDVAEAVNGSGGLDQLVIDAVGELTNMVAGRAKTCLEELAMSISLPSVITGRNHLIEFPSNVPAICVAFSSPFGALCLEVGLIEQPQV